MITIEVVGVIKGRNKFIDQGFVGWTYRQKFDGQSRSILRQYGQAFTHWPLKLNKDVGNVKVGAADDNVLVYDYILRYCDHC